MDNEYSTVKDLSFFAGGGESERKRLVRVDFCDEDFGLVAFLGGISRRKSRQSESTPNTNCGKFRTAISARALRNFALSPRKNVAMVNI